MTWHFWIRLKQVSFAMLGLAGFAWGAGTAHGQGTVTFANSAGTAVVGWFTGEAVAGGLYKAGLYYALAGTPANPDGTDAYQMTGDAVSIRDGGLFFGGTRSLPGIDPGMEASLQVRAWSATYDTYEEAYAAGRSGYCEGIGVSIVMTFPLGGGALPTPTLTVQGGLESFGIYVCPEPSLWLLGWLVLPTLLVWRRGK